MSNYALSFISDEDLLAHVAGTISQYRFDINLKQFNNNLIDPIKLTFDSEVYGKTVEEIIETESIRQIDKSNTNHIGYFHQNIFNYFGADWEVPASGYDVVNEKEHIFVEMKNKHNTMNSASSQKTYMKMQDKLLKDDKANCYLVEVIAKNSQNITWKISLDGEPFSNNRIRRVSIDKFYEIVTGEADAFKQLCQVIPFVIKDAVAAMGLGEIQNNVFSELHSLSPNILESIYLLSFKKYEGFNDFKVK